MAARDHRDGDDHQPPPPPSPQADLRIRGRQARLELVMRLAADRHAELQRLALRRPVSGFPHRNRIHALLRGRFLRNGGLPEEARRPPSVAARELGQLRQQHPVSGLRFIDISRDQKLHLWKSGFAEISFSSLVSAICSCGSNRQRNRSIVASSSWIAAGLGSGYCRLLDECSGKIIAAWRAPDGHSTKDEFGKGCHCTIYTRLKAYFEENPTDLDLLKHDKMLSNKVITVHLRDVSEYLIGPTTKEASNAIILSRAAMGIDNPGRKKIMGFRRRSGKSTDPLRTFSPEGVLVVMRTVVVRT